MANSNVMRRDTQHSILGGVCSGLAAYFGLDKNRLRIAAIVLFIFAGVGALLYIGLWIIIPKASTPQELDLMNRHNG